MNSFMAKVLGVQTALSLNPRLLQMLHALLTLDEHHLPRRHQGVSFPAETAVGRQTRSPSLPPLD